MQALYETGLHFKDRDGEITIETENVGGDSIAVMIAPQLIPISAGILPTDG